MIRSSSFAFLLIILVFTSPIVAKSKTRSKFTESGLRSFVRANVFATRKYDAKNNSWAIPEYKNSRYFEVTIGKKGYIYNWQNKLVKTRPSQTPTAGIMGHYVEVNWELLDKDMKQFSDIFGLYIVRFDDKKWREIATSTAADGYGNELKKAKVPAAIVKRVQG